MFWIIISLAIVYFVASAALSGRSRRTRRNGINTHTTQSPQSHSMEAELKLMRSDLREIKKICSVLSSNLSEIRSEVSDKPISSIHHELAQRLTIALAEMADSKELNDSYDKRNTSIKSRERPEKKYSDVNTAKFKKTAKSSATINLEEMRLEKNRHGA